MISAVRVELVTGQLGGPALSAAGSWTERRALLITLESDAGAFGQGEAAPLPGYSPDSLDACHDALGALGSTELGDLEHDPDVERMLARAVELLPPSLPAARFALETALLDLAGKLRGLPSWALLGPSPPSLSLCALLGSATDPALGARAAQAVGRGITTFKVKIGVDDLDAEIDALRALRAGLPLHSVLRLDANRKLGGQGIPRLAELAPEFVEEPSPPAELRKLAAPLVPLALDESLQGSGEHELSELLALPALCAVVLKPMALGGVVRCLSLARAARARGLGVVVSHLFDGPLALSAAAALALRIGSPDRAMGLDLHAGLAVWPAVQVPALGPANVLAWTEAGHGLAALGRRATHESPR